MLHFDRTALVGRLSLPFTRIRYGDGDGDDDGDGDGRHVGDTAPGGRDNEGTTRNLKSLLWFKIEDITDGGGGRGIFYSRTK